MRLRLSKHQARLLLMIGTARVMLVQNDTAKRLVARGLLREDSPGGAVCVTPAGLRALADEMEAGRCDDAIEVIRKNAEARRVGGGA